MVQVGSKETSKAWLFIKVLGYLYSSGTQSVGTFKQVAQGYSHISKAYLHSHMIVGVGKPDQRSD